MKNFYLALRFLTRFGIGDHAFDEDRVGASMAWFPMVGLLIGLLLVLVYKISIRLFPSVIADLNCIIFGIWITRGLHLDGLCDTADGLYVGGGKALKVMRDSQIGSMAAISLWVLLTLKLVALSTLGYQVKLKALLLMPMVSRWMIVMAARLSGYAREGEGLGKLFMERTRWPDFLGATLSVAFCLPAFLGLAFGIEIAVFTVTVTLGLIIFINRRIGGLTGDTLGAVSEIAEVVFLLYLVSVNA